MSYLFKIENKRALPNPETLLIHPFSEIWDRDTSSGKEVAIMELSYVEFMVSYLKSNPFRDYSEDRKETEIRKGLLIPGDWQPDDLIKEALEWLEDQQKEGSFTYRYWLSNKNVLEKQIEFFSNVNLGAVNMKTMNPLYKPRDIPDAVATAEKVLITINNLQKKVEEELYDVSKTKGEKTISPFANPDSLR